jgi:hypothetical protein
VRALQGGGRMRLMSDRRAGARRLAGAGSAAALLVVFLFVWRQRPGRDARESAAWFGGMVPHPVLGHYFTPGSRVLASYPDDPRGYLTSATDRARQWRLSLHDSTSRATLETYDGRSLIRVRIDRVSPSQKWNIQLDRASFAVQQGYGLRLSFRARADAARNLSFGISQDRPPWHGLGLYRDVRIDTQWTDIVAHFLPSVGEDTARLHFDLAGASASVELDSVVLRRMPSGEPVPTTSWRSSTVSYRFDAMGCRGRGYPLTRVPGTWRLLALGDSYALGVGVHERDVFSTRLETALNGGVSRDSAASPQHFEVINCAVPGYGTHEERLFYERHGVQYDPDVVLLVMTRNDDRVAGDEVSLGYRPPVLTYERVGAAPAPVVPASRRFRRSIGGASRSVTDEIPRLREALRRHGARLAVVIFRDSSGPEWDALRRSVESALVGSGVPVLDLGPALKAASTSDPLRVHDRWDPHPNDIAHRIAGDSVRAFLERHALLGPATRPVNSAPRSPP